MTAKEKKETIEIFETYIKYIESRLNKSSNWLCLMDNDIEKRNEGGLTINCGFNNRMLPNAIDYLLSQTPTKIMNKVIYNKPCFIKDIKLNEDYPWWNYDIIGKSDHCIIINTEKIDFLKHLISKLKK